MPGKAHKRGIKGSFSSKDEKRKRDLSKEQICVVCAMDRAGNLIAELVCNLTIISPFLRLQYFFFLLYFYNNSVCLYKFLFWLYNINLHILWLNHSYNPASQNTSDILQDNF